MENGIHDEQTPDNDKTENLKVSDEGSVKTGDATGGKNGQNTAEEDDDKKGEINGEDRVSIPDYTPPQSADASFSTDANDVEDNKRLDNDPSTNQTTKDTNGTDEDPVRPTTSEKVTRPTNTAYDTNEISGQRSRSGSDSQVPAPVTKSEDPDRPDSSSSEETGSWISSSSSNKSDKESEDQTKEGKIKGDID